MGHGKLLRIGGYLSGGVLIAFGIAVVVLGIWGFSFTRDHIEQEAITFGPIEDPAVAEHAEQWAGEPVDTGRKALAMAEIMKLADAPSSLTAFFLYKKPDYAQEIDIEIFNDSSRKVIFSTYAGGAMTHTVTSQLPFDATADFHEYTIEYGPGSARFLADGVQLQSWSNGVTRSSMYLFVNAWFPSWLAGERPTTDRYTYVDWVEHVER